MTTIVQQYRQKAADAQKELERVLVEETDERPALVLQVHPGDTVSLTRRTTRNVSQVEEVSVVIHDDELAVVASIFNAMRKTV